MRELVDVVSHAKRLRQLPWILKMHKALWGVTFCSLVYKAFPTAPLNSEDAQGAGGN